MSSTWKESITERKINADGFRMEREIPVEFTVKKVLRRVSKGSVLTKGKARGTEVSQIGTCE